MENANDKRLFWACFVAMTATAFGFFVRGAVIAEWADQFGLNEVEKGQILGVGIWPFAVSIILFSLIIDKIGYGRAMLFAFLAHSAYGVIVICAPMVLADPGSTTEKILAGQKAGYWMLWIGYFIFGLGNGAVEAVVNPVVATMFSKEKTKWLNILHAGWPGGLVFAGLMTIALGQEDWRLKIGLIFLPVLTYGVMMIGCRFPIQERVAAGGSYLDMLKEFGVLGAIVVFPLIVREVFGNVFGYSEIVQVCISAAIIAVYAFYARSLGRPMFILLLLIMFPLATTELGTDGWITNLMEPQMTELGLHAAWVLVYTSMIMMVLRFFAGPIVHKLSPLGLLAVSSLIAAIGLIFLSKATGVTILAAATLYGLGKTFFWPTMLGVVSERFPKGGALTLNATGGVGMLAAGVLGFPFIGLLQENAVRKDVTAEMPNAYAQISVEKEGVFGAYRAVDPEKKKSLDEQDLGKLENIEQEAKQGALATMAIFPTIMLVCYLGLIFYFKSKGGYQAEVLTGHAASDEQFTGGVEGPIE